MFDISEYDKISEFLKEEFKDNYHIVDNCNISRTTRLVINDHPFAVMFHRDQISLWANDGSTCLKGVDKYDYKEGLQEEQVKQIYDSIKNYLDGFINCDGCGKLINKKDIAGYFFAGVYCKDCWERYYKKRAEEENYE